MRITGASSGDFMPRWFQRRSPRGSALSLTIIVSLVLTGLAMSVAWLSTVHASMAGQIPKMDASFYAAEAAAQHAVWKFKHDNTYTYDFSNGSPTPLGSIVVNGTTWNYWATVKSPVSGANLAWKFDENSGFSTADSSGNGNTGTFHGGVTWATPGRSGACIAMDGTQNTYVDCGSSSSTNLTGDVTFSAWVKMNSGYYDQKIGGNQNNSTGGYKLCVYNSKLEFEVRDGNNKPHLNRDIVGGTILTMGTWYHLVGVYNANGQWIKTYVNGLDKSKSAGSQYDRMSDSTSAGQANVPANALGASSGAFRMGCEPWDTTLYNFNGYMDDIRIWNRCLSEAEIQALYDTTVDIHAYASDGTLNYSSGTITYSGSVVANQTSYTASIPTPAAPTIPAITTAKAMTVKNITVNGDLSIGGNIKNDTGNSTITGDLNYTGNYTANSHLTVTDKTNNVSSVAMPNIDYTYLHNQATNWGQVVNGNSVGQTFTFNGLGGNKVIWIKGNLEDPVVTISGTYAAGGTFVVDGSVKFTTGTTSLGLSGYPVYIVAQGNISQTGGPLTLYGALYTTGNFDHKNCTIYGPVVVNQTINNNSNAQCVFTTGAIPWFDNRALPQAPTLPMYTSTHTGIGP